MVHLFGEQFKLEIAIAILAFAALSLIFLRLNVLLFLTLSSLLLPSMDTPISEEARILRWAFLGALLVKGVMGSGLGIMPRPALGIHRIMGALSLLVLASVAYSIGPEISLAQGTMILILWGAVFAVLWNSWATPEDVTNVCNTFFVFAASLFTVQAVYILAHPGGLIGEERFAGIFLNPNGAGSAVAFLAPFVYWKFRSTDSGPLKNWILVLSGFMILTLGLSGARSAWVGSIVCMGVVLAYVHRMRTLFVASIVTVPFLVLLALLFVDEDVDETSVDVYLRPDTLVNLSDRLPMWERGLDLIEKRPFLGYGYAMNKFAQYGRADYDLSNALEHSYGANYHSSHIQLALDLGCLGLLLFWAFIYVVLKRGTSVFRAARLTDLDLAGVVFFGAFLTLLADSLVHGWVFSPGSSMAIIFWVTGAAVVKIHLLAEERELEGEEDSETVGEVVAALPAPLAR